MSTLTNDAKGIVRIMTGRSFPVYIYSAREDQLPARPCRSKMPKKAPKTETFTPEQVKEHCSAQDLFVIVHGRVYDITGFVEEHP